MHQKLWDLLDFLTLRAEVHYLYYNINLWQAHRQIGAAKGRQAASCDLNASWISKVIKVYYIHRLVQFCLP